jgi:hypothetical protein
MAYLYIEEYGNVAYAEGSAQPIPGELLASQRVAVGVSSLASTALNARTKFVKLSADITAQWNWNGDAVAGSPWLPQDSVQFFAVNRAASGSTTIETITTVA